MKTSRIIHQLLAVIFLSVVLVACQNQASNEEIASLPTLESSSDMFVLQKPVVFVGNTEYNQTYDPERGKCVPKSKHFCLNPDNIRIRVFDVKIPKIPVPKPCIEPFCGDYPVIPRGFYEEPTTGSTVIFTYEDYVIIQRIQEVDGKATTGYTTVSAAFDIGIQTAEVLELSGNIVKPGKYITIPNVNSVTESIMIPKTQISK